MTAKFETAGPEPYKPQEEGLNGSLIAEIKVNRTLKNIDKNTPITEIKTKIVYNQGRLFLYKNCFLYIFFQYKKIKVA